MKEKISCRISCVLSDVELENPGEVSNSIQIFEWEVTSFSKTTLLQRKLLHQLSIAGYQRGFYANNYFEYLPIVYSAFKGLDNFVYQLAHDTNPYSMWIKLHVT